MNDQAPDNNVGKVRDFFINHQFVIFNSCLLVFGISCFLLAFYIRSIKESKWDMFKKENNCNFYSYISNGDGGIKRIYMCNDGQRLEYDMEDR